ncbi:hypothetical protein [Mesorhizobium sp. CN2-181]
MSKSIDLLPNADISTALLEAADTMRTLRILLGIRRRELELE